MSLGGKRMEGWHEVSLLSDDVLPCEAGVRKGRHEAGWELWASPEWSSFTRDDMVLVMESAATSRSLRRFLLVPEESQSRWRCQVGGHGEGRAEHETPSARSWDTVLST